MEELKASEKSFNVAVELEEGLKNISGSAERESIKEMIEKLLDLAIELEEKENAGMLENSQATQISENQENAELKMSISENLKLAKKILIEKAKERVKGISEKSKGIVDGMVNKVNNMYDSTIEFIDTKKEEQRAKIAKAKNEKKEIREIAIEELKTIGRDNEEILAYETERDEIESDLDSYNEEKEIISEKMNNLEKTTKAIVKYNKKGFFTRFINNFSELNSEEQLSEEQQRKMMEESEKPKKVGFFSKVKQAFSKARDAGKDDKENVERLREEIMQKFVKDLADKNKEISELENILAENDERRAEIEGEKKEKIIEIVKAGKLKVKDLQEMVENEVELCSSPKLIVAQAKISSLKDKFSRILNPVKEKNNENEKENKDKPDRNDGMDR